MLTRLRQLKRIIKLLFYNWQEFLYFKKHSTAICHPHTRQQLEAIISVYSHSLERSMSLENPKKGFGQEVAKSLIKFLKDHESHYCDNNYVNLHYAVIKKWYLYNADIKEVGFIYNTILGEELDDTFLDKVGAKEEKKEELLFNSFPLFAYSRHSIRNFKAESISRIDIMEAISIARTSPSACNRQPVKVHIFENKNMIKDICNLQGGANGFIAEIDKLLLITCDFETSTQISELRQPYVDGGLFAMNLLYALHWKNLGACILNWNVNLGKEKKIKRIIDIPDNEKIIIRIAVGALKDNYKVACSLRKNLNQIAIWH